MTGPQRTPARAGLASGIVLVDKPSGPTSHDIVARARRAFRSSAVGHAGTLDPAASGLLVLLVGQATKLGPYATDHDKIYEAEVQFGRSTTTWDAEGTTEQEAPVPEDLVRELDALALSSGSADRSEVTDRRRLASALEAELHRTSQVPPAFSAIKQGGRHAYELARRGALVELPPRPVAVRSLTVVGAGGTRLVVRLNVAKGYYVRSFARDLGEALSVPAHLARLRRLASGPFRIDEAVPLPAPDETLGSALLPLASVVGRVLPVASLTERGLTLTRHGRLLTPEDFVTAPAADGFAAWLAPDGHLAAVGRFDSAKAGFAVERGFTHEALPGA